ncbi:NEDD8-activating enzyme E1 regulatory subunit AXL isoform X2 [Brassica rapa]|uniref:NEDD8-activating enzyme E1 regulatory subunit AXL isoform X2 n=1 Tax=Brassica campestris TaxID=3711 RepID=UPI00142E761B|nr:NEDD8-activating enzyme E1 regulatory subunit AXL isoform X2 [Brassica rapa]
MEREPTMSEPTKTKYDRQLRIWGEVGQAALENASICLLNCGPTGSEALKNLVLGGIGSVTVVDGSKVEIGDLGNNFMVDKKSVGESKAKTVCAFLQELNDAVRANFVQENPDSLILTDPSFFSQFTLVVATQEHTIIDSKPDHFLDDLRLNNPWPELKRFVETIDLKTPDPIAHKHIPYVVILVKMADEWAKTHSSNLPSTREEKREFKDLVKSKMVSMDEDNYKEAVEATFKVFAPRGISKEIQEIIDDRYAEVGSNSSAFWVMVAALKEFISNEGDGEAPLEGSMPDMTSSTEHYINLQKIYHTKAEDDCLSMEQRVKDILAKVGRDPSSISKQTIKSFCKNARKLKVCRYRTIEDEFSNPSAAELQKCLASEDYSSAIGFYILLRAVDRFAATYKNFPGQFDGGDREEDASRLRAIAVSLINEMGCDGYELPEELCNEMCRFGAAELHVVAAFVGGIASQEVIKLITKQFVPMLGTFVFNGIDHNSQSLTL